ncbi:MAG: hypothetical protein LUC44_08465, partial [Prevotellaceae bacterium]|nr:hypothetical protein [Prevotellaceae bacterium]
MKIKTITLFAVLAAVFASARAEVVTSSEALQTAIGFFYNGVQTVSRSSTMQELWDSNSLSASSDGLSKPGATAPTVYVLSRIHL